MIEKEREIGWLIETATGQYWRGGKCGWTPSPLLACRFARAEDAHAAREWLRIPPVDVRVTEHVWIGAAPRGAIVVDHAFYELAPYAAVEYLQQFLKTRCP